MSCKRNNRFLYRKNLPAEKGNIVVENVEASTPPLTFYLFSNTIVYRKKVDGKMLLLYTAIIDTKPDQQRFEKIYYNYRKQMLLVAERVLHNMDDAEDAVQNALFGIARNIQTVPVDERVERAYVLTAAKNAALTLLPHKKLRDSMEDISEMRLPVSEDMFQHIVNCHDYDLLVRTIRQLETPYLEVLTLVYVQEQSIKAAAEILCRKEETVRKQLQRGKKRLIELCKKEGICFG